MPTVEEALIVYIETLCRSRETSDRSEDRAQYTKHLAAAAEMVAALRRGKTDQLLQLVNGEERNVGSSYLSGSAGEAAETAFRAFASSARSNRGG